MMNQQPETCFTSTEGAVRTAKENSTAINPNLHISHYDDSDPSGNGYPNPYGKAQISNVKERFSEFSNPTAAHLTLPAMPGSGSGDESLSTYDPYSTQVWSDTIAKFQSCPPTSPSHSALGYSTSGSESELAMSSSMTSSISTDSCSIDQFEHAPVNQWSNRAQFHQFPNSTSLHDQTSPPPLQTFDPTRLYPPSGQRYLNPRVPPSSHMGTTPSRQVVKSHSMYDLNVTGGHRGLIKRPSTGNLAGKFKAQKISEGGSVTIQSGIQEDDDAIISGGPDEEGHARYTREDVGDSWSAASVTLDESKSARSKVDDYRHSLTWWYYSSVMNGCIGEAKKKAFILLWQDWPEEENFAMGNATFSKHFLTSRNASDYALTRVLILYWNSTDPVFAALKDIANRAVSESRDFTPDEANIILAAIDRSPVKKTTKGGRKDTKVATRVQKGVIHAVNWARDTGHDLLRNVPVRDLSFWTRK